MEIKDYSARSASIGSMEAARRAGIRQAAMQEISTVVPIMPMLAIGLANIELSTPGSIRVVSAISDVKLRRKARLVAVPMQRPIRVTVSPLRSTRLRISDR
jgi:hypothetical protein